MQLISVNIYNNIPVCEKQMTSDRNKVKKCIFNSKDLINNKNAYALYKWKCLQLCSHSSNSVIELTWGPFQLWRTSLAPKFALRAINQHTALPCKLKQ